ncbi:MAG: hypothetical protein Q9192_002825 [Flavoplaca navasiana]
MFTTVLWTLFFLFLATLALFLGYRTKSPPAEKPSADKASAEKPRACKQYGSSPQPSIKPRRSTRLPNAWKLWQFFQPKQWRVVGSVDSLYVHPIKSCRAVRVEEADVLSTGLKYDRSFTFAEFHDGDSLVGSTGWNFVTQRKYGQLANICVEIWVPDSKSKDHSSDQANVLSEGVLRVEYPVSDSGNTAFKTFEIPYNPTNTQISEMGYTLESLTIWKDRLDALMIASTSGVNPPGWIKDIKAYIGGSKHLALFRVAAGHERELFRNAPRREQLGYQSVVGFVDAYPLHILGLSSVADVDQRLAGVLAAIKESTALRFRANIYFDGPEAYAEDSWKNIRIGQSIYHVACRTTRCELPNTDQWTGEKHRDHQPSKLIKSYRSIDEGAVGKACMGMQMVPAAQRGIIKVGDKIRVLETTDEHKYIKQ